MLALRILEIVFPLLAIAGIGYLYGRRHSPEMDVANRLNMEIFVPALVFSGLTSRNFDLTTHGPIALAALLVVLGSGLLAWPFVRASKAEVKTFIPPLMFCNAGNMGLPLMLLAFGNEGLAAGLVMFLVENFLHFTVGIYILDHRAKLAAVFRQPTVIAGLLGVAVSFSGVHLNAAVALPIEMLGQISIPLMLFALGVRLSSADLREWRIGLAAAVAAPLTGIALAMAIVPLLGLQGKLAGAVILFGALPPAVLNYIFSEMYEQEPSKVAAIVILGNLLALVSIPLALAYALPRYG